MASVEGSEILYLIAGETLFSDVELEEGQTSGPRPAHAPEPVDFPAADLARRVFWPFSRMAGRSSVRGNC